MPMSMPHAARHGLDAAFHRPVPVHADVPDTLQPHAADGVVRGGLPPAAVPVLGKLDRVEPVHPTKTRIAGRLIGLDPTEERRERVVEATKNDGDHKVGIFDFRCGNSERSTRERKPGAAPAAAVSLTPS